MDHLLTGRQNNDFDV